jgi:hypothetical protein
LDLLRGHRSDLLPVLAAALPSAILLPVILRDSLPWLRGPAPYPPEWQWSLRSGPLGPWLPVVAAAAALLGLVAACATPWAMRRPRLAAAGVLSSGVFAGFAFQIALAATHQEGVLEGLMHRAESRTISSYYTVAVSEEARDPWSFLSHFHERLRAYRETAKHAATHPPGPVLYYRAALWACERATWLSDDLLRPMRGRRIASSPDVRAERAAGLLGALVLGLLAAAAAWPTAALGEALGLGPLAAAQVGLLYELLPGPALMIPQFDAALALPVAAATALLALSIARGRVAASTAALAGALAALAFFVSYGAVAFIAIGAVAALSLAPTRRAAARAGLVTLAIATATAVLLTAATTLSGYHLVSAARTALEIHRESYTAHRSYLLWLIFDPLDFALFLGAPLAALALTRLAVVATTLRREPRPPERFGVTLAMAIALLVASGVTRGEVGRIWIPLMPLVLVAVFAPTADRHDAWDPLSRRGVVLLVGALLAALCLAIRLSWEF